MGPLTTRYRIISAKYTPGAALTSDNSTYADMALYTDNANGGSSTVIAAANTKNTLGGGTGSWTAKVPVSLTVAAANVSVPAGNQLIFGYVKGSTGVVVPAGTLQVIAEVF